MRLTLFAFIAGGGLTVWILLKAFGPTLHVRRLTFAYLVASAVLLAAASGPMAALKIVGTSLALGLVGMSAAVLTYRVPWPRNWQAAAPEDFPRTSVDTVTARTAEATAARLEWIGDRRSAYRVMGSTSRSVMRFFTTPDRRSLVMLYAHHSGPMVSVFASCVTETGRILRASNTMDDFLMFPTPAVGAVIVPAKSPLTVLLARLKESCGDAHEEPAPQADPLAAFESAIDRWVGELVARGTWRVRGAWAGPTLRSLPGAVRNQIRLWLT